MSLRTEDTDDEIVIRDAFGRKICEIQVIECRRGSRARIGFTADRKEVLINRRSIDRLAYPHDYPEVKS